MTLAEIRDRFYLLSEVLYLCRTRAYFSVFQKMCVHQERAALLHAMDSINQYGDDQVTPEYTLPAHLQAKIIQVQKDLM